MVCAKIIKCFKKVFKDFLYNINLFKFTVNECSTVFYSRKYVDLFTTNSIVFKYSIYSLYSDDKGTLLGSTEIHTANDCYLYIMHPYMLGQPYLCI